jgi:lipopolysaccharide/colanic/teichoic acid biosynthesis glycosyltransferase
MQPTSVRGLAATRFAHEQTVGGTAPRRLAVSIPGQPHALYDASKRGLDVLLALMLAVLALPVVLVGAAAVVLTTRQSPILVQRRVGNLGREFSMLKLRTMRPGSGDEPALPPLPGEVPPGEIFVAKAPDDPRVTAVGRVLRRTSIDELPQLLNVLAGQMSLVGPRPALPDEVARYPDAWYRRLAVKPGLTGLWQVSGRSDIPPRRRVALDVVYVRRRSLEFDCAILARTIVATISMRGAW